jgi:hypothetical protein
MSLLPFLLAAEDGDLDSLELMLAENAVLYEDGDALTGASRIAVRLADAAGRDGPCDVQLATVDGRPGRLLRNFAGDVVDALSIDDIGGRIQNVYVVRSRDELATL